MGTGVSPTLKPPTKVVRRRLKSAQGFVGLRGLTCDVPSQVRLGHPPRPTRASRGYPPPALDSRRRWRMSSGGLSPMVQRGWLPAPHRALTVSYRGGVGSGAREAGSDSAAWCGVNWMGGGAGQATRAISTARLHVLPRFHLPPIDVVVSYGPSETRRSGSVHLGRGFPLRCFQRLSRPDVATRRCPWRNNRYTSGRSIPVLSY